MKLRIVFCSSIVALLIVAIFAPSQALAQAADNCLYNDEHFHIQDFKADGPPVTEILKMMEGRVCRTTLMALAITVAQSQRLRGEVGTIREGGMPLAAYPVWGSIAPSRADAICGAFSSRAESSRQG